MTDPRPQSGFAYIAAIVFLVVIAGIAVALLRLTDTQQQTVNQALLGARASLAARAGIEWAVRDLPNRCEGIGVDTDATRTPKVAGKSRNLTDFVQESGFRVSVTCSFRSFREGQTVDASGAVVSVTKRIYRIESVACNGGSDTCPDDNSPDDNSVARPDYAERARVATVCMTDDGNPCN